MKNYIFPLLWVVVLASAQAVAQEADEIKIDELNIPTSPAFVFLDKSPANIEKPSNPKALAVSLLNAADGGGALEFTPYWLGNHKDYDFEADVKDSSPFWQTLAFSVASVKEQDTTQLSFGFRVQLFRKFASDTDIFDVEDKIVDALVTLPLDEKKINALHSELNTAREKINWNIEAAGALSARGTEYKNLTSEKYGLWLNIRHTPKKWPIDFVALARYTKTKGNEENEIPESSYFDYGLSISKQGKDFDLQLEYVNRNDTELDEDYDRLAFVANYKITEGVVAVASFGQDFDEQHDIFTVFGIKIGLSKQFAKMKAD